MTPEELAEARANNPGPVKWRALLEACADVIAMSRANRRRREAEAVEQAERPGERGEAREALLWMSKDSYEAYKQLRVALREYNATFRHRERKTPRPEDADGR